MSGYELQGDRLTCEGILLINYLQIVYSLLVLYYVDINECFEAALRAADACEDDANTQCINDEGSFNCTCVPGYHRVGDECQRKLGSFPGGGGDCWGGGAV